MKQRHKRRAVELCKDALILLLTCSALWLAGRTQLLAPLSSLMGEDSPLLSAGQEQESGQGSVLPMAMVVNIPGGTGLEDGLELPGGSIRTGLVHDQAACQDLFQQIAGVLVEAVSGADAPASISRDRWEQALTRELGVCMDFQGELPVSVLAAWLSGGETRMTGTVRRLVLTAEDGGVALYYRDETDGSYYRCTSRMGDPASLEENLIQFTGNGAFYAFESEEYESLAPDTLLFPDSPSLGVYTATNPVNEGEDSLRELVEDLGFSLNATDFYPTDDWVARSEGDSVRLSDRGEVEYTAGEENGSFPVIQGQEESVYRSVETCRQITAALTGSRCGEARVYLSAVRETGDGFEIEFEYSLNGVPVRLEQGCAARFVVSDGHVAQFTMCLRSYAASGTTSVVMPPKQALAAFSALDLDGKELLLAYNDGGGDTVSAGWVARDGDTGEG